MRWRVLVRSATFALPFLSTAVFAQPAAKKVTLDTYWDLEDVQDPQPSPDGKTIIYTRRWVDKINDRWESSLWTMNADGTRNRFLVNGSGVHWSPDGLRIAYTASGQPTGTQIFVKYMDKDEPATQVTRLAESPGSVEWAPDGKSIAFTMLVREPDEWRVPLPQAPRGAKWTEPPRVVTRLNYRRDRQGFVENGNTQIFVVPAEGGTPRQVTSGAFNHSGPNWSPDGKWMYISGNRIPDAEYSFRESEIYAVNVETGDVKQLTSRNGPDNNPTVSPTGKLIAYAGYDSSGATWQDSRLYVMNADGSNRKVLTDKLDRSPSNMIWAPDESGIYFGVENEGSRNLYFASLAGDVKPVTKGNHVLSVTSIDKAGNVVGVVTSPLKPNDVVSFTIKNPVLKQLTAVNDDIFGNKTLGTTEEVWYTSVDGFKIQGWIVKPPDFDPKKKYPLMLEIHGGPHSMYNVGFNFARQDHVANGYVMLYTNPRGSTGYGSAFGNAIKNAYPGKDYDDLMAGVDTVINRGYIDKNNLFVYGCSGGGVLTAWTVGHTDRFTGAVSMCPVIDWISFVGTTDGSSWYYNFEKRPWEDPTEHLRRSPLMYVGNVKTPTMLMTGVLDLRTPISQTEEFYEALKLRKVPTAMIRFNEEYHGTSSKPSNYVRTQTYLRAWFSKWAKKGDNVATTSQP